MRTLLPLFLLPLLLLPALPASAQEEGTMLHMIDYVYAPERLEVAPGETVILMNFGPSDQSIPRDQWGEFTHSVTAVDGSFDVQNIPPDFAGRAMPAPSTPGEYPFYCRYHGDATSGMRGVLVVMEAAAATPPPASPTAEDRNDSPLAWIGAVVALAGVALFSRRR